MSDTAISAEIFRLSALPLAELRAEWHRWHADVQMPKRLPRDLLVRTIAWKLQEKTFGGMSVSLVSRLDRLSRQMKRSGTLDIEREAHLKVGTVLVREWHGQTHRITALDEGFLYNGQTYASLSEIARAITGTHWSGPRFFGLNRTGARAVGAERRNG